MSSAKNLVSSFPRYISLAIALDITAQRPPVKPCTNLRNTIIQIFSTKTIPKLAKANIIIDITSGFFRPILSDIGPTNRLPNPKPIINKDKVSCAFAVVVLKSFLILVALAKTYL